MKPARAKSDGPFVNPRFREGTTIALRRQSAEINYRDQGADIDFSRDVRDDTQRLLCLLKEGGHTQVELTASCPDIADRVGDMIREFDRLGLLTESATIARGPGKTGIELWCELQRFIACWETRVAESRLHQSFVDGSASRNQVIGYVLEYYHVVHLCPALIGPALGHLDTPTTQRLMTRFLLSEAGHDAMIAEALSSVGIEKGQLETMQPLPMTFAVCSSLGVYASQHPLSLKGALFLLERPQPEFHSSFSSHCRRLGLPEGFVNPILKHAEINSNGNHEDISRALLNEVVFVSTEEETTVKKHVGILLESMTILEQQILEYYGGASNHVPRCFQ